MSSKRKIIDPSKNGHKTESVKKTRTNENTHNSSAKGDCSASGSEYLSGISAYILPAGISKARSDLFKKQLICNGGKCLPEYSEEKITHLIVDDKMEVDRMCRILKIDLPPDPRKIFTIKSLWLSACLKNKERVSEEAFALPVPAYLDKFAVKPMRKDDKKDVTQEAIPSTSKDIADPASNSDENNKESEGSKCAQVGGMWRAHTSKKADIDADPDSDYSKSGNEEEQQQIEDTPAVNARGGEIPKGHWICAHSSDNKQINYNPHITQKLQELANVYENTNDRWRALGYAKAIMAVKKYHKPITTFEEAKALPGVGTKLAEKIWEIVESGELRKLDELSSQEDIKTLKLFTGVWGAGAHTARAWLQQGHRTLDDLRDKANLTRQQKIGLRLYHDLLDRMPREEATEIEKVVIAAAHSLNPGLICMACGSYRRGKATCGDVDILLTHPDGKSHKGVFSPLLNKLRESGFLTDDLVTQEDSGNQKKYLGVCRLPGPDRKHRRLDIIVVPYDEYACALMYFTGSAHFNRSMRHMAGKMNMSLSEHSLNKGVVRQRGQKINEGYPLPTPTEESVFQHLGLKYRAPTERDH